MESGTIRKSRITWTVEAVSVLLLLLLVGLVSAQVFMRYIMDAPLTWSEEAARIAEDGGLTVVMDACIGATHAMLRVPARTPA